MFYYVLLWLLSLQRTASPDPTQRRQRRDSRKSSEIQSNIGSTSRAEKNRVMISNLSSGTTERKLKTLMAEIGKIEVRFFIKIFSPLTLKGY